DEEAGEHCNKTFLRQHIVELLIDSVDTKHRQVWLRLADLGTNLRDHLDRITVGANCQHHRPQPALGSAIERFSVAIWEICVKHLRVDRPRCASRKILHYSDDFRSHLFIKQLNLTSD